MCALRQLAQADGRLHLLMQDYQGLDRNSLAGRLAGTKKQIVLNFVANIFSANKIQVDTKGRPSQRTVAPLQVSTSRSAIS